MDTLAFFALSQLLPLVLSCGGGGSNPPPPPPACSWRTCRNEWRDDWSPSVQQEQSCTTQKRTAHHVYTTHSGKGSCPETVHCNSESESRIKCSCRYLSCRLGAWSKWYDLPAPARPEHWASQQRQRGYVSTAHHVVRDNNCDSVGPLSCPGNILQTIEKVKCTEYAPVGFQSGVIKDSAFSASSHYKSYPPSQARLNAGPGKAWYAEPWDIHEPWIKIDLGTATFVSAVASQGKRYAHFVTSYRVKYSEDNKNWNTYDKELSGNTNYMSVVKRKFDKPLYARYIRIEPIKWNKNGIAMKLELYKCTN